MTTGSSSESTLTPIEGEASGHFSDAGEFDFVAIIREQAKLRGRPVESMLWHLARSMFLQATKGGDAKMCEMLLNRLCGVQGKGEGTQVLVDNRQITLGPPAPHAGKVEDYIAEMNTVAQRMKLPEGDAAAIVVVDEEEDIFS